MLSVKTINSTTFFKPDRNPTFKNPGLGEFLRSFFFEMLIIADLYVRRLGSHIVLLLLSGTTDNYLVVRWCDRYHRGIIYNLLAGNAQPQVVNGI